MSAQIPPRSAHGHDRGGRLGSHFRAMFVRVLSLLQPYPYYKEIAGSDEAAPLFYGDDAIQHGIDWTPEEEKALVRKLDCLIMPLLTVAFYALQLDRGNIGNALTDFFLEDVGITQDQFNVGQQLLSAGIVLLEIPSNLVLYRLGPQVWISSQILVWGFIATFQAFQHGLGPFLATRLLLGLGESGFIPASLYCISMWYKRDETTKRFSIFFLGNMTAVASSGLIAYGILHMRGICGLGGWQWLFLLEGIFTIVVGGVFCLLMPKKPSEPRCFLGINYFSARETEILTRRILLDDPRKAQKSKWVSWVELKTALSNWKVYPHVLFTLCALSPTSTMTSYAPTLVKSFGYERLKSNALVSVGGWCQLVLNVCLGIAADKFGRRGPLALLGVSCWWAAAIANRALVHSTNMHARYAVLMIATSTQLWYHPINGSWMALNSRSAGERSITMALFIMAANAAGIIGSQLFQASDKPLYVTGWTVIVCLISLGVFWCIFCNVMYFVLNKRAAKHGVDHGVTDGSAGESDDGTWSSSGSIRKYHP